MNSDAKIRIKRFSVAQRLFHLVLMLTFLTQAATGLARMYHETGLGRWLATLFGGYQAALTVHIYVGVFMICAFALHVLYVLIKIDWRRFPSSLFGPDSLLPGRGDLKQMVQHVGWILGLARHPPLERWGYWEKFDYWAVFWGMVILGGTGLLLVYPLTSSRYLPGWGINVAFWIHRIEAILAMAHIFVIHYFIAHLRRSSFPMDKAIFTGNVDMAHLKYERTAWLERLRSSGELGRRTVAAHSVAVQVVTYVVGLSAVVFGLVLLVGGVLHAPYVLW